MCVDTLPTLNKLSRRCVTGACPAVKGVRGHASDVVKLLLARLENFL
jgi:hypothetical protein